MGLSKNQSAAIDTMSSDSSLYRYFEQLLSDADIKIDGKRAWDMQIHRPGVPERVLSEANLGLGESYMDGDWDSDSLDEFFYRLLRANIANKVQPGKLWFHILKSTVFNRQNRRRAWQVGQQHYDLGNDFFAAMLDSQMTYTCGYWKNATTLEQAQQHKLDLICQKLQLKPGMTVLDIGCGWASFMSYAAKHYGVKCAGVTISQQQIEWAKSHYDDLDLECRLQDYREINQTFDRIVSIGMFEHVGHKNYRAYMEVANRCLKDNGLFLLHTIGNNKRNGYVDPWIDKYIFPNGELPSIGQIGDAVDELFVVEDMHNFGADYDKTLMAWHSNFEQAWPKFASQLGERFYRMWRYYLLSCAGAFRAREMQLWQWVLSKQGVNGVYPRIC